MARLLYISAYTVIFTAFFINVSCSTEDFSSYNASSLCGTTLDVFSPTVLRGEAWKDTDAPLMCKVRVRTVSGYNMSLDFQGYVNVSGYVCPNEVHMYLNGATPNNATMTACSPFNILNNRSLVFTSDDIFITYHYGNSSDTKHTRCIARLLVNPYHTGVCAEDEYRCTTYDHCINGTLECNFEYDTCGSYECHTICIFPWHPRGRRLRLPPAIIAIIVVVILTVVIFVGCLTYARCKQRKLKMKTAEKDASQFKDKKKFPKDSHPVSLILPPPYSPASFPPPYTILQTEKKV